MPHVKRKHRGIKQTNLVGTLKLFTSSLRNVNKATAV